MSAEFKITDYLKVLIEKTEVNKTDEFYKRFQPYIVIRFLSMDKRFLTNTLQVNKFTFHFYKTEQKPIMFDLINTVIPRSVSQFTRYIKGQKKTKYPNEVYLILKKIYGDYYSKKDLEWIIDTLVPKNQTLRNELKEYLLNSGLDYKELVKYFPTLFQKEDFKKISNSSIKNEMSKLIKAKKKEQEKKKKEFIDDLI